MAGETASAAISAKQRGRMLKIIGNLQKRLGKIEKERVAADKVRSKYVSPEEARKMIEEIKVPSLENIRGKGKR